jgi:Domain of unknown function (DUF4430)
MTEMSGPRGFHRYVALLAALLLVVGAAWAPGPAAAQSPAAAASVRLVVDYGNGVTKTIAGLPWSKGETVLDAMKAATRRAHGISFSYTGSGAGAMLAAIDGERSQGGGAAKKNWQYWVNAAYGDKSFAAYQLHAQDVVTWRFATEQGTTGK